MMGVLKPLGSYPVKAYMHQEEKMETWARRLCDLLRVAKPNLAVIDATTEMWGSHLYGETKKT
jgi:uncharacterized protein (DUF362 family)